MKKILTSLFVAAMFLALSAGNVFAQETTPITGTVESIEVLPPDAITGETVVVVTILDETSGTTQTVNISLETAEMLGLVTVDETTGEVVVNEVIDPITIEPIDILPDPEEAEEETEAEHPVGSALGEFFGELLGIEYTDIKEAHEDGFGFGVIAQALWLTNQIEGDTDTFNALLEAKKTGDYSAITLADGSTPENWGDVVTSLKKGENLGSVMSGKAENTTDDESNSAQSGGQGNGKGNGNSNAPDKQENAETEDSGNDKGKGKGNGNGNGNGNSQGKGNNGKGNSDKGGGNGKGKP